MNEKIKLILLKKVLPCGIPQRRSTAFHAHVRAIQANPLPARSRSVMLCNRRNGEPWETGRDGGGREMQIMAGRMWSNGKMFSVAGKKDSRHVDSPRRRSARSYECNRSALVSCLILCGEIYARSGIAFYLLRMLEVAFWKELTRYVEKFFRNNKKLRSAENCGKITKLSIGKMLKAIT